MHAATHDPLTGLPNRGVLLERLERALARADGGHVAVLFVDIDNFKLVNDSLGHKSGDEVLCEMARRIGGCVGPDDTVSRFGGDELVILHPGAAGDSDDRLGMRILAALSEPVVVAGREVAVGASVGVASCRPGAQPAEQLLRDADTALYAAKHRGRARMERFNDELRARALRRVQIESDLRAALRDEQLAVHYQPQVNLQTGHLVGLEALARWRHPLLGTVSPAEFIPIAEESGLIGELGRQVLRTACRQLALSRAASPEHRFTMTVNVSPRQIDEPGFVAEIQRVIDERRIPPESLCLELTESALMNPEGDTVAVLDRVRALGVYLAIDDFGMKYSSLARLRSLPVEVLKIDRSFIDGLSTEPEDTAVVSSILSLAFAMGKHVIAEGVERPDQAAALRSMGCAVAQGYLFSQPVEPAAILPMLGHPLWRPSRTWKVPSAPVHSEQWGRRGQRSFIDEFLDHIGAPMGAKPKGPP
jgi:diguanylate cyclase (GGDEF)-like protein